ncbi:MAG TPA: CRISPR-associated ring nuclease Csm6 [Xanthobacteraceae bacterium]|nr:CRISPR-associated ring nuclease Csm6 [Xanthobacteraceae bacterium]
MTRRVLMMTTGETPQLVTETLHHLGAQSNWWPDEVVLATTRRGDDLCMKGDGARIAPLLGERGRLAALAAALGRPRPKVKVAVACHRSGMPIDDIRSEEEVNAIADALLTEVRRVTEGDTELHLSLSGGRKTMSYLAGAVLSLYGRPQDVLSHVLLEPKEMEFLPEFWWPGQTDPASGEDDRGRRWSAAAARTRLHRVPFLRLRAYVPVNKVVVAGEISFAEAVKRANDALAIDRLTVDTPRMTISAGGSDVAISEPVQFAIYRLLAEVRMEGLSVGGREAGALRYADLLVEKDAHGRRLLDRLGDIIKDVWIRGKDVDMLMADQRREEFVSLRTRESVSLSGSADITETEIIERKLRSPVSDLRRIIREGMPEAVGERAAPAGRGFIILRWDAGRIDVV